MLSTLEVLTALGSDIGNSCRAKSFLLSECGSEKPDSEAEKCFSLICRANFLSRKQVPFPLDESLQHRLVGQQKFVLADKKLLVQPAEGVAHRRLVFAGAKQQTDGRLVFRALNFRLEIVEVGIHVSGKGRLERLGF